MGVFGWGDDVKIGRGVVVGVLPGEGTGSNILVKGGKFSSPTITTPNVVMMATHI